MPTAKRQLVVITALLAGALAGCGSQSEPSIPVSSRLVGHSPTSRGQIILSQLGAQRIGIQTMPARAAPKSASGVVIPYSAIIYDPSGKTYAFTNPSPLTFVEVPISVERIAGESAYLKAGPKVGAKVVTVGAEELYGVQTGVLAQS